MQHSIPDLRIWLKQLETAALVRRTGDDSAINDAMDRCTGNVASLNQALDELDLLRRTLESQEDTLRGLRATLYNNVCVAPARLAALERCWRATHGRDWQAGDEDDGQHGTGSIGVPPANPPVNCPELTPAGEALLRSECAAPPIVLHVATFNFYSAVSA